MPFWISALRAIFALVLGVAVLTIPNTSRPLLTNFVGMFWLAAGALNLIDLRAGRLQRPVLGAIGGWIGILAGGTVLAYSLAMGREGTPVVFAILGVLALLIGLMHLQGAFEREEAVYWRVRSSVLIGSIELVLGFVLVVSPLSRFGQTSILLAAWAFAAAMTLGSQALYRRGVLPRRPELGGKTFADAPAPPDGTTGRSLP